MDYNGFCGCCANYVNLSMEQALTSHIFHSPYVYHSFPAVDLGGYGAMGAVMYRIRQTIRGGKLSRFGQQMVIRGKTFTVQDTFVIKRLNVKGRKSVTRVERAIYSLDI